MIEELAQRLNIRIDAIDLKILRIMQENGKITNIQLSNQIGLSPAPTLERVKKLENSGLIKSYHALLNTDLLGLGINAMIQISLARQINNAIQNFQKQILEIDEITECYQVTGTADYILKATVKDMKAFENLISEKLSRIEEIGQMQTMMILSTIKQSHLAPINYE
ncbi:MAG: Lrp/AsnC family transcriptional regulator [Bacteroidia bacterium]